MWDGPAASQLLLLLARELKGAVLVVFPIFAEDPLAFTVEVQGELNLEILGYLEEIEMEDWSRGGKIPMGEISPRRAEEAHIKKPH